MSYRKIFIKLIASVLCVCILLLTVGCSSTKKAQKGGGLVSGAVLSESNYKLGDYVGDYTITDINGNTYTFSELLGEKKAIVLNFWYIDCVPCQLEFPYMQSAYNEFKDDIALIAINPIDGNEKNIKKFANNNSISLPLASGDNAWITAFGINAFPTTVIIDCYGSLAFYHTGYIVEDGVFENMFAFFTSDSYEKSTINNIENFK